MKTYIECRLPTDWVLKNFSPGYGKVLNELTTKVILPINHPDVSRIQDLINITNPKGFYYSSWFISKYTKEELDNAQILRFRLKTVFEPAAEECDENIYDYDNACTECGSGRVQTKPLRLDVGRLLAGKDFAKTIAEECICSVNFCDFVKKHEITGVDVSPVYSCKGRKEIGKWFQLVVKGHAGRMTDQTTFGNDPFDNDVNGIYKCSKGHLRGLRALSEVHIDKNQWDGSDMAITTDFVGLRAGLLVPSPVIIISQRLYKLMKLEKITCFEVEVAHLD